MGHLGLGYQEIEWRVPQTEGIESFVWYFESAYLVTLLVGCSYPVILAVAWCGRREIDPGADMTAGESVVISAVTVGGEYGALCVNVVIVGPDD